MINSHNPFREFRAEQMGHDLWELYVPWPVQNLLSPRPLIIEGGRGSGKTMFFLCNSWRERLNKLKSEGRSIKDLLSSPEFVGLYYKVDTAFVTSMYGEEPYWEGVFNTYFGISIAKEMLGFVSCLIDEEIVNDTDLINFYSQINYIFKEKKNIKNIKTALVVCDEVLDEIELFLNNPEEQPGFKYTIVGRLVSKMVVSLTQINVLERISFKVFVDEYETFLEYQQKAINTLIKQSNSTLVYNIGMRPKGMITSATSGGGAEIIQAPHDYNHFRPEVTFDPEDSKETKKRYVSLLKEICRRRIDKFKVSYNLYDIPDDIEYYLGSYSMDNEIQRITQGKKTPPFLERLKAIISDEVADPNEASEYIELLAEKALPLHARLHLCLLLRSNQYKPKVSTLAVEYKKYLGGGSDQYSDWVHNTKYGLVFLLAKEYDTQKQYYGFDVYMMLSNGVIRYFLELCEQAFDFAMDSGFNWAEPAVISPEDQTKAARYVSRYKIKDIDGYEPYGRSLRIFVHQIGNLFRELHRNTDTTLGEPEPNHFSLNSSSIDDRTKKVLDSAVMWGVLQERNPTKEKDVANPEIFDYHLNRIYCPFYEISYRKKRKITFNPEQFRKLMSGSEELSKSAVKEILLPEKKKTQKKKDLSGQLSLFDGVELLD